MLKTEQRNQNSINIDKMSTAQMLSVIQEENYNAVRAIDSQLSQIQAAEAEAEQIRSGAAGQA